MQKDKDVTEQIKKLNLPEIINQYNIKQGISNNGAFNYYCPFHSDMNPSLKVNYKDGKWLWHCFGCGEGGDVLSFVVKYEQISMSEAIRKLKGKSINTDNRREISQEAKEEISVEAQKLLNKTVEFYHSMFFEKRNAYNYLVNQRNIYEKNIFSHFKVGYADGSLFKTIPKRGEVVELLKECGILNRWGKEHFSECVIFPVVNANGDCVEIYGRSINEASKVKHLYLKGSHKGVFNYRVVKTVNKVILTEGIIDCLSVYQAGFKNVIPLYGTNGLMQEHIELFKNNGVNEVYLCLDADEAGVNAGEKIKARLESIGIKVYRIELPEGTDANEYFKNHGREDFEGLMIKAGGEKSIKKEDESKDEVEVLKDGLKVRYGVREYYVRGIEGLGNQKLRVNIKAVTSRRFHIDTVDLYVSRARKNFAREAGLLYGYDLEVIEEDLNKMIEHLEQYAQQKNKGELTPYVMSDDEKQEALMFLRSPGLIDEILKDFEVLGCCGERMNKLMGYLTAVSRKTDDPLSMLVLSRSAAGKSMLQDTILKMVPDEDKYKYTRITGQALFYKGEDALKHKVIAIEEEEGSNQASYSLRTMQSSKKLTIASTTKDPLTGSMKTQEYEVKGPLSIMITTTSNEIDYETMNRFIVLTIDESREQTKLIHQKQRERDTLKGLLSEHDTEQVIKRHQNAQRLLKNVKVVNPYALCLRFMDDQLRARRDHKKYLNLIKTVAFLHQYQREVKKVKHKGEVIEYIEVTLKDIELSNGIAHEVLGRSLDELSPQSRKLLMLIKGMVEKMAVKSHRRLCEQRFSRRDIREHIKWSDHQVRDHLRQLVELEYVVVVSGRNGSRIMYELLYEGGGEEGGKFFMGLTNVEEIRISQNLAGQNDNLADKNDDLAGSLPQACGHLAD